MEIKSITIDAASVKVMRSFDYCHFEVCLSATLDKDPCLTDAKDPSDRAAIVDELRKTAARLADKAVEQYIIAKADAQKRMRMQVDHRFQRECADAIRQKPEAERSVEEQAQLKAFDDKQWAAQRAYDYQDDWDWDNE